MAIQIDELPYDIQLEILKKLNFKDLITLCQVSHKLNAIANDNVLWKIKLMMDMHKWRMIESKSWPKDLQFKPNQKKITILDDLEESDISFKKIYLDICPEVSTTKGILKKIKSFQQSQSSLHATSTSENLISLSNNLTLSSLSSFAMPMVVFGQIKDFVFRNVFRNEQLTGSSNGNENIPKLVLFGPGLETSTSCIVTNILWKSEFKTVGMIPGKDGYGAGIKLKLFNHKPFNLTILYTNNKFARSNNNDHNLNENRLLMDKVDAENPSVKSYELHPRVKEACADANGFIYVIDNDHLSSMNNSKEEMIKLNENSKTELQILMNEVHPDLPLLVLSLKANDLSPENLTLCDKKSLSCVDIVHLMELNRLKQDWLMRDCQIFQPKMKDIMFGFEWILNELDQKILNKQQEILDN